jgi:hypothetical protein
MNLKTNNTVVCEVLENRSMMSVAVNVHAPAVHTVAAAHVVVKPAPKATVAPKTQLPALMADPAVTDSSITYKNFSTLPLFSNAGPSVNDINQGDLGDCYFLSTLSAVAKVNPSAIRKDIVNNNDGTYTVNFTSGSTKKQIRVDADLPTWSDGELAYANFGAGRSLWVAVLEKAFADFRTGANSYGSIEGGWMSEAFSALGIKSQSTFAAASATALAKLMAKDLKAGDAATFGTGDTITDSASLISDHAYEIDSVTVDKKGNPLSVTLRNPWGVDGIGSDGNDNGYVTLNLKQVMDNMVGMVVAKV